MDDESSGATVLDDDDGSGTGIDHDDDPGENVMPEDAAELAEHDPAEEDTPPVNVHAAGAAAEAVAVETPQETSPGPTVLDRMRSAGISNARALEHLQRGWVRLDGQVITDPEHPAAPPARWVILP